MMYPNDNYPCTQATDTRQCRVCANAVEESCLSAEFKWAVNVGVDLINRRRKSQTSVKYVAIVRMR